MKEKVVIKRGIQGPIMNAIWHGAPFRAAAKIAGIRPKTLRRYRRMHKIYDTRLKKLREPYTLFKKFIKGE